MSLLNLPRATLRRSLEIQAYSKPIADELLGLLPPLNAAIEAVDDNQRCFVFVVGNPTIPDSTQTTLTFSVPVPEDYPYATGLPYDLAYNLDGIMSDDGTTFTPTRTGLYLVSLSVYWASGVSSVRTIGIDGNVEGTFGNLAQNSVVTASAIQQVSIILAHDAQAPTERTSGGWTCWAYQESGGGLQVTVPFTTCQVVRVR